MEIIYKSKNFIVINKPVGMPSQSDSTGDPDAMTLTETALREKGEASALWLVHRLDRTVGGLMAFARTSASASRLSSLIQERKLIKEYLAVTEGECSGNGEMRDYLYRDSKISKAFVVPNVRAGVKEAVLSYENVSTRETPRGIRSLVKVSLKTGRYHQIRVQFASRKLSLVGDGKYGSTDKGSPTPALFAHRLAFKVQNESVDLRLNPDKNIYPWNLWSDLL